MSNIEKFLNDFCGIPGIKINIISPSIYELIDTTLEEQNVYSRNKVKIDELFITIGEDSYSFEDSSAYVPNDLLCKYIKNLIKRYDAYSNTPRTKDTEKGLLNYTPSVAIINAALKLNLITVTDRKIVTHYEYSETNSPKPTKPSCINDLLDTSYKFSSSLPADPVMKKYAEYDAIVSKMQELEETIDYENKKYNNFKKITSLLFEAIKVLDYEKLYSIIGGLNTDLLNLLTFEFQIDEEELQKSIVRSTISKIEKNKNTESDNNKEEVKTTSLKDKKFDDFLKIIETIDPTPVEK
jgi:hypothetical protein